ELVGHEELDRLSYELLALVAEQPLRLRVDQRDPPLAVHDDDRVGRRLEQSSKARFAAFKALQASEVGDVLLADRDEGLESFMVEETLGHVDVDERAVLSPSHRFEEHRTATHINERLTYFRLPIGRNN